MPRQGQPQSQLLPPENNQPRRSSILTSARAKWYNKGFRLKFSFKEPARKELFDRLEKLLSTSDKIAALETTARSTAARPIYALENVLNKARKR